MPQLASQPWGRQHAPHDNSTRLRILAATAEVMGRHGMTKLSLTAVALEADVSRPTLYRWFPTKKLLLDAYVAWERSLYERAVAEATAGLPPEERLDAALRVIAQGQQSYPGPRIVDIEPALVIDRLKTSSPACARDSNACYPDRKGLRQRQPLSALPFRTTWF